MSALEIEIDPAQLTAAKERLAHIKNGAKRALSRALNKTAAKAKTVASRAIRDQISLSAAYVRDNLKGPSNGFAYKATINKLDARISAAKRGLLLYHFAKTGDARLGTPRSRIKLKVKSSGGAVTLASGFWIRTKGSNLLTPAVRNVILRRLGMTRQSSGTLPYTVLHGPSLSQVLDSVKGDIGTNMSAVLAANLTHEMEWLLTQYPPPGDDGSEDVP